MADAVTSQTLLDDSTWTVMKFTNVSDGTGESAVLKVDVSTLVGAPTYVSIVKIQYAVVGMVATLLWDATTDVRIVDLAGNGEFDFDAGPVRNFRGLTNNSGAGKTGDIMLTTVGHTAADSYTIILYMRKGPAA